MGKYIMTFENFGTGVRDYFKSIIGKMFPGMSSQNVDEKREEIVKALLDRAKENLDSKPSVEKEEYWKSIIDELLDTFRSKGHFMTDAEEKSESENAVKEYNIGILNSSQKVKDEIRELPDYVLDQVGYDTIVKFLAKEDETTFQIPGVFDFSKKSQDSDDIMDDIKSDPKYSATWEQVSERLRYYYKRRLVANIPSDKKFGSVEEAERFVRVYTEKFIYGYLEPRSGNQR